MSDKLALFDNKKVRTHFDNEKQEWYFSAADICSVLINKKASKGAGMDWLVLKNRLKHERSDILVDCKRIWLPAEDGRQHLTDVLETEQVMRLVQAIPSPKAEQLKEWLSQIGTKKTNEFVSPEIGFHRLFDAYRRKGYSNAWIARRVQSIETRADYEKELRKAGVMNHLEYAELTNEMLKGWSGMNIKEYKEYKELVAKENLRDNMSRTELFVNTLGEETAAQIIKNEAPRGFEKSKRIAIRSGNAAYAARKKKEIETGKSVLTQLNFTNSKKIDGPPNRENER